MVTISTLPLKMVTRYLLSRLAQPFSSYCSNHLGQGFEILTSDRYKCPTLASGLTTPSLLGISISPKLQNRQGASAEEVAPWGWEKHRVCPSESAMTPCTIGEIEQGGCTGAHES